MDSTTQNLVNSAISSAAQSALSEKRDGIHLLNNQVNELQNNYNSIQAKNNSLNGQINQQDEKIKKLEQQVEYYRQLLCKPLGVIAENNDNFKKSYDEQMQTMADWMISQKAFKELAIEFGFEKGLKLDDVVQMGKDKKKDVISSKNDPSHKTNSDEFMNKYGTK